ncbi:[protein-PII] uridylyltransferase [Mergibacter septicus]|uniref:bifunctional uridylyltransferase/uridylyl-removing protein GlnD n=1 Tax=Mergibacter septicus TaxID=221402 RepID=UPI001178DA35|nr:bifunctional uridylyltransferase/uridylyl-removing protein GlnD [Mergibacter septicus]AWX13418.1 [protein-PII] uridylyltransferase [Mergibacter septicus]
MKQKTSIFLADHPLSVQQVKQIFQNLKQTELAEFQTTDIYQLLARRTQYYDHLLNHLWYQFNLNESSASLIVVGGYGRQEMFPLSDIDFLILCEQEPEPKLQEKIENFVHFLWDCHFEIGCSVRTIAQCVSEGKTDITIATNLLEARFLNGNLTLFDTLVQTVRQDDFWDKTAFVQAKLAEKEQRYQRYHNTAYNLEPDLKYSPGGLRDLHLFSWIALRCFNLQNFAQLLSAKIIYPEEYQALERCQRFLFRIRFALHLLLKRYDNRLLFDRQLAISELLGYTTVTIEQNRAVELMMKEYFRHTQAVIQLSEVLILYYQEHFLTQHNHEIPQNIDQHFELINEGISIKQKDLFEKKPEIILDLFSHLITFPNAHIHSSTLRALRLALLKQQQFLVDIPLAREKFIALFSQSNVITRAILPMHRYGVLEAYLPQWKNIVGLMQFDLFHEYSVDEHTIRLLLKLEKFAEAENAEIHPLCHRIYPSLPNKNLLLLAALFHDIAKGQGGNHAENGAIAVYDFALLHGFSEGEAKLMAWLILDHLLMSTIAQRRDIHDPMVVQRFASMVRTQQRLDYLVCLTVADICATNAKLWNSWKRSLITTLYKYTTQQLAQGINIPLDNRVYVLQHRLKALEILQTKLANGEIKVSDVNALWQDCPDDYFLRNTPKQLAWHAQALCQTIERSSDQKEVLLEQTPFHILVSNHFSRGATEIFIYCQDQPNLFNKVVKTLDAKNFLIHNAQIITNRLGVVFDSFIVTEASGVPATKERRQQIMLTLKAVLTGKQAVPKQSSRCDLRLRHFDVPLQIRFLQTERNDQTELELITLDKPGLLASISDIFSQQKLNLVNAQITTNGEKVEDFFILTDQYGQALDRTQIRQLQLKLEMVLGNRYEIS